MDKNNEEVLAIPERTQVFDDPRTHAKTLAIPFQFKNGTNGILMISRLSRLNWRPQDEIESIIIRYK